MSSSVNGLAIMIISDELGPILMPSLYVSNFSVVYEISLPDTFG